MEHTLVLSKDNAARLKQFHFEHFPGQNPPSIEQSTTINTIHPSTEHADREEDLGYYDDGVRRTLTDDQISMFRNSEIQRIIKERRKIANRKEQAKEKQRKQHDGTEGREGSRSWTKHFDEAPKTVDTLMYDDEPVKVTRSSNELRQFLWPKLG